jgi:hypothetical protein
MIILLNNINRLAFIQKCALFTVKWEVSLQIFTRTSGLKGAKRTVSRARGSWNIPVINYGAYCHISKCRQTCFFVYVTACELRNLSVVTRKIMAY